jgi:hypothetical protein
MLNTPERFYMFSIMNSAASSLDSNAASAAAHGSLRQSSPS